jgi:small GTP-binding protein
MSKSGKIVFDQAPSERDEMNMSSSLSGALASNPSASSKDVVFNRDASMSTALLRLPDDFETRQTIDGMFADLEDKPKLHAKTYGEDDDDAEEEEEEEGGGEEEEAQSATDATGAAGSAVSHVGKKGKRDTPASLPKMPVGKRMADKKMSILGEDEEEEGWGEEEEEEAEAQSATDATGAAGSAVSHVGKKGKRDTPASLPQMPVGKRMADKKMSILGEDEEEEGWGDDGAVGSLSAPSVILEEEAVPNPQAPGAGSLPTPPEMPAEQEPPVLPFSGWLMKQSGGKLRGGSVGNALAKWDRRWFLISGNGAPLCYYKDAQQLGGTKRLAKPAGTVEMSGSSIERTGGGDGTFSVHSSQRVLTLKADNDAKMQAWARAMVAAGAYAEFEVGTAHAPAKSIQSVRPSLRLNSSYGAGEALRPLTTEERESAPSDRSEDAHAAGERKSRRKSVTLFGSEGEALPLMEGYLSKQTGRKAGAGAAGKWDRRYFVVPPGKTSLRYYKTRDDYVGRLEPAGAIDTARSTIQIERSPGAFLLHITSADLKRQLALRADSNAALEAWIVALKAQGRALSVETIDPTVAATPTSAAAHSPTSGGGRKRQATEGGTIPGRQGSWEGKAVKVLLLGDAAVGKTSVLTRFSDGLFVSSTRATVGIDLKKSTIDLDGEGKAVQLQIWDTAGQEMFRSIIASYYRGAHGVLLMFDLTRKASFDSLEDWLKEVRSKAPEDAPVVLCGNKCDCPGRVVSQATAAAWARQHGMQYVETSAKANIAINDAFVTLVATAMGRGAEVPQLLSRAKVSQAGGTVGNSEAGAVRLTGGVDPHSSTAPNGGCAC